MWTKNLHLILYWIMVTPMIMMTTSLINKKTQHPMVMLLMLIMFTIKASLFVSKFLTSFFFSYLMFMVTIGGTLIIFMYMVSLTNKDSYKIKTSKKNTIHITLTLLTLTITFTLMMKLNISAMFNYNYNETINITKFINNETFMNVEMMYMNSHKMTILSMILILIVLISVAKLCSKHKGPLRQMK